MLIESDLGVGIIKGGWHYPAPQPTKDTCSGTGGFPCDDADPLDCLLVAGSVPSACASGGEECEFNPKPVCASCGEGGTKVCDASGDIPQCVANNPIAN